MSRRNLKVVGAAGAIALAAGMVGTLSAAPAHAAEGSVNWTEGGGVLGATNLSRKVSDATPTAGETITITTGFSRTVAGRNLYNLKEVHDTCLTYVPGSAKTDGAAIDASKVDVKPDYTKITGDWWIGILGSNSKTFSFQYKVGDNCPTGALMTRADYDGTQGIAGGTSAGGTSGDHGPTITVKQRATSTTLAAASGAEVGKVTPLTATVTGGITGTTVEFYNGTTKIGQDTLGADGKATFNWTPTDKGAAALKAKYVGNGATAASESAVQNVTVGQTSQQTSSVNVSAASGAQVGTGTVLTADVTPGGNGGTVTFKDGGTVLATAPVSNGKATYTWVPQTSGSRTITADFSGRDGVAASSGQTTVTVADKPAEAVTSKTTLTVGALPTVGGTTTLTATIDPTNAGGTVTFKDGGEVIGTASVNAQGVATLQWKPANGGQRTIKAEYSGAGKVQSSSASAEVTVTGSSTGGGNGNGNGNGNGGSLGSLSGGSLGDMFGSSK